MKTLLLIQSSLFGETGQSSRLARAYADRWQARHPDGRVRVRDLAAEPPPHLDAARFAAFGRPEADRSVAEAAEVVLSDELVAELVEADEIVIGMPMYNFTVPSTFKAWMDHVARAGVTFRYTASGPVGLTGDRPVTVFAARGGQYAGTEADTQTPLVRGFFGLLGIRDLHFVYAEGLAMGDDTRRAALDEAHRAIEQRAA